MCGICGVAGRADEATVRRMTDAIAHRGPDGDGVRAFPSVDGRMPATLGHRRLSIIDPTPRGAQPMPYADGRYWITYNGELYNFRELRGELEADGFRFASDCDTEVLLAMYARHGERMLDRLNGIFAFALWDAERAELFLARDRLGVKPLYYAEHDGTLAFASEVKALLPAISRPRLDETAIGDYLTFLWVPDPHTMFAGVHVLEGGHCATYSAAGGLRVRQYWDMDYAPDGRGEDAWVPDVRDAVKRSIRRQMVSDVPLGSFLSGGLDSSAIVAEMTAAAGRISTYTVGLSAHDLEHEIVSDDVRYSRVMAEKLDLDYHERILEADVVDLLPKLVWHMDEPVADPAAITTFLICSAAREQLTVILSGMGGDEIFAGYPRYLAARWGRMASVLPQPVRAGLSRAVRERVTMGAPGRLRGPRRNLMKFARGLDATANERYLTHASYYRADELDRVLRPELRPSATGRDPYARHRACFERVAGEHWLNQLLYVDMKTFLPCLNLTYTDKMSMAASTEVRVPLLDNELVELSGRVPPALKLRGLKRKYVFKRSQEGILPHDVIWRPKAGFTAPLRSWLVGDLRPMVEDVLSPAAVRARGHFDPAEVERLLRTNASGEEDNALRIWSLLTLELWQQQFTDAAGPRPAAAPAAVFGA
ncbi:MAG TPA: asparagine synthase (glutamine-hydrolyzing) [Solirubrobacteraceae bacterium]|jgi:asparagine synthase (glutamine-hydrolysing)